MIHQKLPTVINKSKPTLANNSQQSNEPIIMFLNENTGIERLDEYTKYDALFDPGDDEHKRMEGWEIVESKIELKDRQGNNRTFVKRESIYQKRYHS
jgi:hypothetical protein